MKIQSFLIWCPTLLLISVLLAGCMRKDGWDDQVINSRVTNCAENMLMSSAGLWAIPRAGQEPLGNQAVDTVADAYKEEFLIICKCAFDLLSKELPYSEYQRLEQHGVSSIHSLVQADGKCAPDADRLNKRIQALQKR